MQLRIALFMALALPLASSVSVLIYNPLLGRSHVNFMVRLADVLQEAGHDVTVIEPIIDPLDKVNGRQPFETIAVPQADFVRENVDSHYRKISESAWKATNLWSMREAFGRLTTLHAQQCNATLDSPIMWDKIKGRKFDVAISEMFDLCGFVLFEQIGIQNTALALSQMTTEGNGFLTGLPAFPSYVPGMMPSTGEKMTFLQRVVNSFAPLMKPIMFHFMSGPLNAVLDEKYGVDRTPLVDLFRSASLVFVNRDPLVDFPAPTLHKIIDIGGVSVSSGPKPLNKTWSDIFDLRPQTVLLSFGTVARSYLMPENFKQNIRETFRKFPDVTFIWKYEKPEDRISEGIPNIVESTFVPQNDMLYDPRLSLFITHCGAGSSVEATMSGAPLILIPVMGDQKRNSMVILRHGGGATIDREDLGSSDKLEKAIREVLGNPRYAENSRTLAATLRDKPFTPKETFVKNVEFLGKYGPLRQLDHYGLQLNFFQYYLVDAFAFLISIVLLVIVSVLFTCRFAFRFVRNRVVKSKAENCNGLFIEPDEATSGMIDNGSTGGNTLLVVGNSDGSVVVTGVKRGKAVVVAGFSNGLIVDVDLSEERKCELQRSKINGNHFQFQPRSHPRIQLLLLT